MNTEEDLQKIMKAAGRNIYGGKGEGSIEGLH